VQQILVNNQPDAGQAYQAVTYTD